MMLKHADTDPSIIKETRCFSYPLFPFPPPPFATPVQARTVVAFSLRPITSSSILFQHDMSASQPPPPPCWLHGDTQLYCFSRPNISGGSELWVTESEITCIFDASHFQFQRNCAEYFNCDTLGFKQYMTWFPKFRRNLLPPYFCLKKTKLCNKPWDHSVNFYHCGNLRFHHCTE